MLESGATVRFTVWVGVSSLDASDPHIDELLRRADTALYQAKRQERNRVIAERPP
ncbi:diguanylate cyclase domain-containing protein [Sinimarinibacterium thermocellulolyticum]|uniref:Diguanylate cyclase n=1 Tax=Sinimarinibacterium thermocellulolyticum TaxID=3170016 RepID=A0ABV2ADF1_9GAMM